MLVLGWFGCAGPVPATTATPAATAATTAVPEEPPVTTATPTTPAPPSASPAGDIAALPLADWQPSSTLAVKRTRVARAGVPAIDAHTHLARVEDVAAVVAGMDALGLETLVNLDGFSGGRLERALDRFDRAYPGRFLTYARLDWSGIDDPGWARRAAAQLAADFEAGAKGLKLLKNFGLHVRFQDGRRLALDDALMEPIWEVCIRYRRPLMWHVADPAPFFTPLDAHNERWHELHEFPEWSFADRGRFPSREQLFAERNRVLERHPDLIVVGAHLGSSSEDLARLAGWLDRYPNFFVDTSARINEIGRQPYTARRFLVRYQDRVLFGTDLRAADRAGYEVYFRFFETDDEYFDTTPANDRQGFWMIYGVYLPEPVLRKLYHDNARRLLGFEPFDPAGPAGLTGPAGPR